MPVFEPVTTATFSVLVVGRVGEGRDWTRRVEGGRRGVRRLVRRDQRTERGRLRMKTDGGSMVGEL